MSLRRSSRSPRSEFTCHILFWSGLFYLNWSFLFTYVASCSLCPRLRTFCLEVCCFRKALVLRLFPRESVSLSALLLRPCSCCCACKMLLLLQVVHFCVVFYFVFRGFCCPITGAPLRIKQLITVKPVLASKEDTENTR